MNEDEEHTPAAAPDGGGERNATLGPGAVLALVAGAIGALAGARALVRARSSEQRHAAGPGMTRATATAGTPASDPAARVWWDMWSWDERQRRKEEQRREERQRNDLADLRREERRRDDRKADLRREERRRDDWKADLRREEDQRRQQIWEDQRRQQMLEEQRRQEMRRDSYR